MRKYYLDNVRWMTIVLVVVYHVIYMYNSIVTDIGIGPFYERQPWDGLLYILYPWFMVLLFIVAGMCSRYYLEKHTVKEFIRSRTRKLLVPSTIGLFVIGWIQGYVSMAISDAFQTIPDTVPGLVLNTPVIVVYRFGIYGFTFLLGYFVFAHDEVTDRLSKYAVPLISASIILAGSYVALHYGDNYAEMPTVNSIPALPCYLLTALAGFVGSIILYEIISRVPIVRWCVLGMNKEKETNRVIHRNGGENV